MHVFLWGVTDKYFPTVNVDPDEVSKSRKLLYVAMTRAMQKLTIFTTPQPAQMIAEIDPSKINFKIMPKEQLGRFV